MHASLVDSSRLRSTFVRDTSHRRREYSSSVISRKNVNVPPLPIVSRIALEAPDEAGRLRNETHRARVSYARRDGETRGNADPVLTVTGGSSKWCSPWLTSADGGATEESLRRQRTVNPRNCGSPCASRDPQRTQAGVLKITSYSAARRATHLAAHPLANQLLPPSSFSPPPPPSPSPSPPLDPPNPSLPASNAAMRL